MKCPVCGVLLREADLRCPGCGTPQTFWKNSRHYAAQSYAAALSAVRQNRLAHAAELLLRAVVLAPDDAKYLDTYGRALAQLGRYREAAHVLDRAYQLDSDAGTAAALQKAQELAEVSASAVE